MISLVKISNDIREKIYTSSIYEDNWCIEGRAEIRFL